MHSRTGALYLHGGRNGNVALRDFWKYLPGKLHGSHGLGGDYVLVAGENSWESVRGSGSPPGCLQGHSMVEYQDILYVFGGELSFCNDQETPLWMFHIKVASNTR